LNLFLKQNDIIEVIAPASKFDTKILLTVENFLNNWGLKAKISCPMSNEELFCSTTEKERFKILKNSLENPNINAIWVAWGGYGSAHLIPYLENLKLPTHPKLLMGFSDTTILHIFFNQKWNWPSLHCPSIAQAVLKKISQNSISALKKILFQNQKPYLLDVFPMNKYCSKSFHDLTIQIVGGNLAIVVSSLATTCQISAQNKFLFLEDTSEPAYRVDRMLHQLYQAKIFDKVKGVILGEFTQKQTKAMDDLTKKVLDQWIEKLQVPIFSCKVGHGLENYPIPLNCDIKLKFFPKPHLKFFRE
jgi:muramoyltetrapeptide carboxypeptidase